MSGAPLLGPVLFTCSGLGVLKLLDALPTRGAFVRLAYAFLTGVATCGGLLYAGSHFFGLPLTRGVVLSVLLVPALGGMVARVFETRRQATERPALPRSDLTLCLFPVALGSIVSAALLLDALGRPVTDWDGRAIWGAHARYIRQAATVDAPTLREAKWFVAHPKYPVLLPVAQVAAAETVGADDDDRAIRPLYAFFFPCLLLVLFDASRRRAGILAAAVTGSLTASLPFLSEAAATCYSDLPLGCFLGAGFLLLLERGLDARRGFVAGILLSGAILTKSEGMILALMALTSAAAFALLAARRRPEGPGWRLPWAAAAVVAASLLLFVHWRARIAPRVDTDYWARFSSVAFLTGLRERSSAILRTVAAETIDRDAWGLLSWTIPLVLLFGVHALKRRPLRPVLAFLALAFSVPLTAYLVGEFDPTWLVETTWKRFLVQMSLPLFVIFASLLRPILRDALVRRSLVVASPTAAILAVAFTCYGVATARSPTALEGEDLDCPDAPRPEARENPSFPASIDRPAEGELVKGDLLVAGWSQEISGVCDVVRIEVDGAARDCLSFGRPARLDVAAALPRLGNCDRAGYEARFEFEQGDEREHEIRVWFRSPEGKVRSLERRFSWAPAQPE